MKLLRIQNLKGQVAVWFVPESDKESMAVAVGLGPMTFAQAKAQIEHDYQRIAEFAKWVTDPDELVAIGLAANTMYVVHSIRQSLSYRNKAAISFGMLRMIPTALRVRRRVRHEILRNRNVLVA